MEDECRTDCVERPLSRLLGRLGGVVGAQPLPFLQATLALSAVLGAGLALLPTRQHNDIEAQFMPGRGAARTEQRLVRETFPTDDAGRFSEPRLATPGLYAAFVVLSEDNVVSVDVFSDVQRLDGAVRGFNANGTTYEQVCARDGSDCSSPNPLLSIVGNDPWNVHMKLFDLSFPLFQRYLYPSERYFLGFLLGNVTLGSAVQEDRHRLVVSARALRLFYYLREDDPAQRRASLAWLRAFSEWIPGELTRLNLTSVQAQKIRVQESWRKNTSSSQVTYLTSISVQEEFEKTAREDMPLFYDTCILTILFSMMFCARLDSVRTKVWVAAVGALSSGLAVASSFGLLLLCNVPFVITTATAPFLILGVAVVDMFILVSCWQKTKVKDLVKDRMAATYAEGAVSITITMLTNVLAFYICTATVFPAIQSFCLYTGIAFIFCYIYNLTFLGAFIALNGTREESNRHWVTFKKVPAEIQGSPSSAYNMCCVGGSYDETTGAELEHPMNVFFRNYFGPFLVHSCTKVGVVVLYLVYLSSSIYGCTRVKEGIVLQNLASDHSYIIQYYNWTDLYFKKYGPRVMVIVTESIAYWNPAVRENLETCMQVIENSNYIDEYLTESWLRIYVKAANTRSQNIDNPNDFLLHLPLLYDETPEARWDINITGSTISASRFFIQTVSVTSAIDERTVLEDLRALASDCQIPLTVYHPAFIYFDQYLVIAESTIQNVVIAAGATLLISLLLIPNPLCSLLVTFAIASIIVGVTGFMAYWGINLDSISMISLVICIGFSVAFSAHISYAFVSSEKHSLNDKAVDALYRCGYPVLQGATSTFVGVLVLSMASSYIFRTFYKIVFLVILFGALHALIFIPVFLIGFFGFCQWCNQPLLCHWCYFANGVKTVNNPEGTPPKSLQEGPSRL